MTDAMTDRERERRDFVKNLVEDVLRRVEIVARTPEEEGVLVVEIIKRLFKPVTAPLYGALVKQELYKPKSSSRE